MHFILFSQIIYMILYYCRYVVLYLLFIHINIFFSWTVVKWQYFCNENCIRKGLARRRAADPPARRGPSAPAPAGITYIW